MQPRKYCANFCFIDTLIMSNKYSLNAILTGKQMTVHFLREDQNHFVKKLIFIFSRQGTGWIYHFVLFRLKDFQFKIKIPSKERCIVSGKRRILSFRIITTCTCMYRWMIIMNVQYLISKLSALYKSHTHFKTIWQHANDIVLLKV